MNSNLVKPYIVTRNQLKPKKTRIRIGLHTPILIKEQIQIQRLHFISRGGGDDMYECV